MLNFKIGLKLWSTNDFYVKPARELYEKGYFDYIELYSYPGSFKDYHTMWKKMGVPFNIHAPHFSEGMNLAKKENENKNLMLADEARRFADLLKAEQIIFHPGVDGDINETIRQLKRIGDKRILMENKPYLSVDGKYVCNGYSVEDIGRIVREAGTGFCLDFGHAVCAANSLKTDPMNYVRSFIELKPDLFHINDSDMKSPYDSHKHHLGQGSYPLKEFMKMVPAGSRVTNEAVKDSTENLDDFKGDMEYLRAF